MASKVFLHIGLPKTGTTYLQTVMWGDRERMRAQGVLLPGRERRDHLWATRVIRADHNLPSYGERVHESWDVLKAEIAAWEGTAIVSHEFFGGADAEQAQRMIAELAPAEVHLVVTAREPVGLYSGSWQESLKNRDTRTFAEYAAAPVSPNSMAVWNWRTLDVRLVLERWATGLDPAHVHVLPVPPPDAPKDLLWQRFATLVGLDPDSFDLSETFANPSMGIAEAETLRRVNKHLQSEEFEAALDRGFYIRTFLADERLVPRKGEPFWPYPDQVADCRERSLAAIDYLSTHGVDVVGDIEHLRVPDELPVRRTPDSVTDAEVAAAATELVAVLLGDVRELRTAARKGDDLSRRPGRSLWRRRSGGR
jgi:hypothetical protein